MDPAGIHLEELPQLGKQGIRRDRFLDERSARLQRPMMHDRVVGIARHEDHLEAGTDGKDAVCQLPPGRLR